MNDDKKRICTELWAEHEARIRKMCIFKLQSCPSEIDDVVADVCLALCKKVSESGPPEKPREWLYGALHNLLNGKYKEIYAKRENETDYPNDEFELPFSDNSIRQKENQIYFEEAIKKAENKLKNDDYLMLSYAIKDSKIKDIAADLNKTETAVKQKRYRTFQKMREICKDFEK